ncbi:MAG: ABC transporter substrate-binding protein [Mycobacteriales bacterium]
MDDRQNPSLAGTRLSRRHFLHAAGFGAAAVVAAPILSACGSGSSSSKPSNGSSPVQGGTADVSAIKSFVPIDAAHAGKGLTVPMGAVLAFTGAGKLYGTVMSNGMKLANKHIQQLGGPTFKFSFKDHKSGDPQAGVQAVKELGFAHVPVMMASYVDDLGAMLPGQAQYKIFTMDGGGGTSTFAQGKPYFWGMRANTPNDAAPGAAKFLTQKKPDVKKVALVGWDLGDLDKAIIADLDKTLKKYGLSQAGEFIPVKVAATDFSSALQKLRGYDMDMVWLSTYGDDPGYFMKQYATSGIDKPVTIFEFTEPAAKIAGSAYDNIYFAYDYFDANHPDNGWSKIFIDDYRDAYNDDPDFYAANYYEDTFAMWECLQRLLKSGGDPKQGTDWDKALRSQPTFKSVYGGDQTTAGEIQLGQQTHSVVRRPMSMQLYKNGKSEAQAYFNIDAADFRLA